MGDEHVRVVVRVRPLNNSVSMIDRYIINIFTNADLQKQMMKTTIYTQ